MTDLAPFIFSQNAIFQNCILHGQGMKILQAKQILFMDNNDIFL